MNITEAKKIFRITKSDQFTKSYIKKQFHKLAHEYHPDKKNNTIGYNYLFKRINKAREVLLKELENRNFNNTNQNSYSNYNNATYASYSSNKYFNNSYYNSYYANRSATNNNLIESYCSNCYKLIYISAKEKAESLNNIFFCFKCMQKKNLWQSQIRSNTFTDYTKNIWNKSKKLKKDINSGQKKFYDNAKLKYKNTKRKTKNIINFILLKNFLSNFKKIKETNLRNYKNNNINNYPRIPNFILQLLNWYLLIKTPTIKNIKLNIKNSKNQTKQKLYKNNFLKNWIIAIIFALIIIFAIIAIICVLYFKFVAHKI